MRTFKQKPSSRKLLKAILCMATSVAMMFGLYFKIISSVASVMALENVKTYKVTGGIDAKTLQITTLYKKMERQTPKKGIEALMEKRKRWERYELD